MKLLHLDASPLGQHSVSRELTAAIVNQLAEESPSLQITYRDLSSHALPHWTPVMDAESDAAKLGQAVMDEFLEADIVVIGAPMYNFGIPSQLKAWIDRVAVAGKTFRYTEAGPEGLAGGKRVIVASSRGGVYSNGPAAGMDFQENYLRAVFGFLGVDDVKFIRAEGVNMSAEHKVKAIASAHHSISSLATKAA
ncbi:FMN-dependent NADH-azoreductase [Dyella nitratireducens]|uniref:FMN dependent NADH:quinone oxidoreductase n=1 Tax=Dyella nitratireducens TaxID=1849580 RepID=A0ABQ1FJ00_9GAMM|nr:NAD(P)H-dependent oxidoreductase [Dyella nitratireducens]GGA17686.1 FMN-dependent NADH-azoreductase [Dyella nitratireducens]GLQ44757.1 FMN-dependent NADH-azoreductase [Dyella nitratireducens]